MQSKRLPMIHPGTPEQNSLSRWIYTPFLTALCEPGRAKSSDQQVGHLNIRGLPDICCISDAGLLEVDTKLLAQYQSHDVMDLTCISCLNCQMSARWPGVLEIHFHVQAIRHQGITIHHVFHQVTLCSCNMSLLLWWNCSVRYLFCHQLVLQA